MLTNVQARERNPAMLIRKSSKSDTPNIANIITVASYVFSTLFFRLL